MRIYHLARPIILCALFCVSLFLAACSTGSSSTVVTPTVATRQPIIPSPTPSFAVAFRVYTGMGMTLEYPSSWVVHTADNGTGGGGVTFQEPLTPTTFSIEILSTPFDASAPTIAVRSLMIGLQKEGTHARTVHVSPTVTVGGQSWDQAAGVVDLAQSGQTITIEQGMLATNHPTRPPGVRLFLLTYTALAQTFEQMNRSAFQPMLQSFTFTS